jgi:hypothetical protein
MADHWWLFSFFYLEKKESLYYFLTSIKICSNFLNGFSPCPNDERDPWPSLNWRIWGKYFFGHALEKQENLDYPYLNSPSLQWWDWKRAVSKRTCFEVEEPITGHGHSKEQRSWTQVFRVYIFSWVSFRSFCLWRNLIISSHLSNLLLKSAYNMFP